MSGNKLAVGTWSLYAVLVVVVVFGWRTGAVPFSTLLQLTAVVVGVPLFVGVAAYKYYHRPGQASKVNDDATDPRDWIKQAPKDAPLWVLGLSLKWVSRNWPTQVFGIGMAYVVWRVVGSLIGFMPRFYLTIFAWAWFTYVIYAYGRGLWGGLVSDRQKANDVLRQFAGISEVPAGQTDIKFLDDGRVRIIINRFIEPGDRGRLASRIAGNVAGAVDYAVEVAEDESWMIIETSPEFESEAHRAVKVVKDNGVSIGGLNGHSAGRGWIAVVASSKRTDQARQTKADEVLAVFDDYVCRAAIPEVSGSGDSIRFKLWKKFPSYADRVLTEFLRPHVEGLPTLEPIEDEDYRVAFKAPCAPTSSARWDLAEKLRVAIPDAEVSAEPLVLADGDHVVLRFLPLKQTENDGMVKAWSDLTVSAGMRGPSDPLKKAVLDRDSQGRVTYAKFRRGVKDSSDTLYDVCSYIANVLDATGYRWDYVASSFDVEMWFYYNRPPQLAIADERDIPPDVPADRLPPIEDRAVISSDRYGTDKGFYVGETTYGDSIFLDTSVVTHIGIWGPTGSGKGLLCTALMMHCIMRLDRMFLISPRVGEYRWGEEMGAHVIHATSADDMVEFLDRILGESDRRERLNARHGCRNWTMLRRRALRLAERGDVDLLAEMGQGERIHVVIEELTKVLAQAKVHDQGVDEHRRLAEPISYKIRQLLAAGRSVEIHLVITQQSVLNDVGVHFDARPELQGRVWMGRDVGQNCAEAMDAKPDHPKVLETATHRTGNFCSTNWGEGSHSPEITTGSVPYISSELAAVLTARRLMKSTGHDYSRADEAISGASRYLANLADLDELPSWLHDDMRQIAAYSNKLASGRT